MIIHPRCLVLSKFNLLAAVGNTKDNHIVVFYYERNADAIFESNNPQPITNIASNGATFWECFEGRKKSRNAVNIAAPQLS